MVFAMVLPSLFQYTSLTSSCPPLLETDMFWKHGVFVACDDAPLPLPTYLGTLLAQMPSGKLLSNSGVGVGLVRGCLCNVTVRGRPAH